MLNAPSIFLDNTTNIRPNSSSTDPVSANAPVPTVIITKMRKILETTRRNNNNRLYFSLYIMVIVVIIFAAVYGLSVTYMCVYLNEICSLMGETIIQARYNLELDLYIEEKLSNVNKHTIINNTLRGKYLNEKGYESNIKNEYAFTRGCFYGLMFGAFSVLLITVFKELQKQPCFGKRQTFNEINKVEQFAGLIKKLENVYSTLISVSKCCVALGTIYFIIIVFDFLLDLKYKNDLTADYTSLLEINSNKSQLIEQNHGTVHKNLDFARRVYQDEYMSNEVEKIPLNTFIVVFTAVGAFIITALYTYELLYSRSKYVNLSNDINIIIKCPAALNEIKPSSV